MEWLERLIFLLVVMLPSAVLAILLSAVNYQRLPPRIRDAGFATGLLVAAVAVPGGFILAALTTPKVSGLPNAVEFLLNSLVVAAFQEGAKLATLIFVVLSQTQSDDAPREATLAGAWLGLGWGLLEPLLLLASGAVPGIWGALVLVPPMVLFWAAAGAISGWILQQWGLRAGWWLAFSVSTALNALFSWSRSSGGEPFLFTGSAVGDATFVWIVLFIASALVLCGPIISALRSEPVPADQGIAPPSARWISIAGLAVAVVLLLVGIGTAGLAAYGTVAGDKRSWMFLAPAILPVAFAVFWWRARPRRMAA